MATITPGTGGTIKSSTAEGALLESAIYVQTLEADTSSNPNKKNFVNVTINTDAKIATISGSLPIEFSQNAAGQIIVQAVTYLVD